jgi:hypothetical protein
VSYAQVGAQSSLFSRVVTFVSDMFLGSTLGTDKGIT